MLFSRPFATLLAATTYATTAYAWFRVACTTPLVSERVDPIISPGPHLLALPVFVRV
jgi:hypothetical protein